MCACRRAAAVLLPRISSPSSAFCSTVAKPHVAWEKDLEGAQKLAKEQNKLVLDFFLLGNLNAFWTRVAGVWIYCGGSRAEKRNVGHRKGR